MTNSQTFAIIGGGIGGLTTAIALQKKGANVVVYERTPEIKPVGAGIVLAANAMKACNLIGLDQEVLKAGKPLTRFAIKETAGSVLRTNDAGAISKRFGYTDTLALHRADLHQVLVNALKPGTLVTGKGCIDFIQEKKAVHLVFDDGTRTSLDYVIAADGIHSIFRKRLLPESQLRYSGYTCWRGITDRLPEGFDHTEATESWGSGKRFGIVPLKGNRVYWFATLDAIEKDPSLFGTVPEELARVYSDFHFPVKEIIRGTLKENILHNDISDFSPIKKFAFQNIVLVGDAAHATTPNLGQGACMAIEDGVVLANTLANINNPEEAFRVFESKRIARTTRIVNTSYQAGKLAQLKNPFLLKLRNTAMRLAPASVSEKQLQFLYEVSLS